MDPEYLLALEKRALQVTENEADLEAAHAKLAQIEQESELEAQRECEAAAASAASCESLGTTPAEELADMEQFALETDAHIAEMEPQWKASRRRYIRLRLVAPCMEFEQELEEIQQQLLQLRIDKAENERLKRTIKTIKMKPGEGVRQTRAFKASSS